MLNAHLSSFAHPAARPVALQLPMALRRAAAPRQLAPAAAVSSHAVPSASMALDSLSGAMLAPVLDLLDYGLVLLSADGRVQQVNNAARQAMAGGHPLQVQGEQLLVCGGPADAVALREAITGAAQRGLRRLLNLGSGAQRACAAVLPLPLPQPGDDEDAGHAVALLLARRQVCEQLTVEWFARSHQLTVAETNVVRGLCAGLTPQQIADQQGVGLATVRTQIGAIRLKTGVGSIGELLREVSLLPPMVGVLQGFAGGVAPRLHS